MNAKKLILGLMVMGLATQSFGYDIIKRTRLVDDKMKTQEMLRPFGHDFLFDVGAVVSPDTTDLMDKADNIKTEYDRTNNISTTIVFANKELADEYDKENVLRARLNLGVPIFSFTAFGVRWRPNFRIDGGLTALIVPTQETFSDYNSLLSNIPGLNASDISKLTTCVAAFSAADDGKKITAECLADGNITQAEIDDMKTRFPAVDQIPYLDSLVSTQMPVVDSYIKADAKVGMHTDFTKGKHWFGSFWLGALGRADIRKKYDVTLLVTGSDFDLGEENTLINAAADFKFGYKNSNYRIFAAAEELKISELSSEDIGKPAYGTDPLLRLHSDAKFRLWIFSAQGFVGSHARSGYGFGDGYYFGVDWGAHVWKDRLGLTLRTMADKEHLTLAVRMKLWLMHLEITSKTALEDKVDGVKVNDMIGANIRFML